MMSLDWTCDLTAEVYAIPLQFKLSSPIVIALLAVLAVALIAGLIKSSKLFAAGLILILFVAHQDFWNWGVTERTVGGLPQGFAYHVGLSIVAAFIWWIVTMIAWPKDEWAVSKAHQEEPARVEQTKTPSENLGGQE